MEGTRGLAEALRTMPFQCWRTVMPKKRKAVQVSKPNGPFEVVLRFRAVLVP
jgi:hypothetical protein